MSTLYVKYLGKMIPRKNFRTFIYNSSGEKYLCESWEDFESKLSNGEWFESYNDSIDKFESDKKVEKRGRKKFKFSHVENDDLIENNLSI